MVTAVVIASTRHPVHGLGLVFLYFVLLGLMLVISSSGSLVTRRWRGREALTGKVRGMERTAGTALRIGYLLTAVGAVGFSLWWLILR